MSKRRFIEKLIRAAGGWENFLYQTLKEVCDDVKPTVVDAGVTSDAFEEARIVVHMYEEKLRKENGEPDEETVQPTPVMQKHNIKLTPTLETKDIVAVPGRAGVLVVKSVPKPEPRKLRAQVLVDKDIGASHGQLPMPDGFKVVNREALIVTTAGGLELGKGSADGQVRGFGASGQVTLNGAYRLVFKDITLGTGLVHFEAAFVSKPAPAPAPKPKPKPTPEPKLEEEAVK